MSEVESTLLACTAVWKEPSKYNPAHHGAIAAVGMQQAHHGNEPPSFWYLVELADGTTRTGFTDQYGIVRHGNQFACTVCKGDKFVEVDRYSDDRGMLSPRRNADCPACSGTGVRQPDQNGGEGGQPKPEPAERKCDRCDGEGKIADSEGGEPWSSWAELPPGSDLAVRTGIVKPMDCPDCAGAGPILKNGGDDGSNDD